ncbi:MAG: hypothetical protein Q4F83_16190 [Eubacteriales bacterium]|nr:hypothetical protein [Eubacteriales bacterium]
MKKQRNQDIDWLVVIPLLLWAVCTGIAVAKAVQSGRTIEVIEWLEIFNSNTFATYISIVVAMLYQFFSVGKGKNLGVKQQSGLSNRYVPLTIISTIIYGIVAVVNASRFNLATTIIMTFVSVIYVILFFVFMKKRNI